MRRVVTTGLASLFIIASVPLALGNTYGFGDEITEDSPLWSCVHNGNHICGPGNPEGKPAGHYDEDGVLDIPWSEM